MLNIDWGLLGRVNDMFLGKNKITEHLWHIKGQNRYIQVSTPLEDSYVHYEYANGKLELHFEGNIAPYEEMIEYLERETQGRKDLEWNSFRWGYRCVNGKDLDYDNLKTISESFVELFDGLIDKYNELNAGNGRITELGEKDVIGTQESSVDMYMLNLGDVLKLPLSIPDYQRIYCWDEQNVIRLLEDVFEHTLCPECQYRLGTIILHKNDSGKYDIIDGQQRLITLALLLYELKKGAGLLNESVVSEQSRQYVAYNKHLISAFCKKNKNKNKDSEAILNGINFSVLVLRNSSLDLAYTFFSNQNSRGVALSDYDLLKAHHLRFIPQAYEQQATNVAKVWNKMVEMGRDSRDKNESPNYERVLDTYIYRLRRWMRKRECEDEGKKYRVKQEYEASPVIDEIPPFGGRFYFNEPIQGGTYFFEYVKQHLDRYGYFVQTKEYIALHSYMAEGSHQYYRDVIEGILFAYYLKFGESYLADAMIVIMRYVLQHRYINRRAFKASVLRYARDTDLVLMIDQATSPTFFLAEARNVVKDMSYFPKDLTPTQKRMREISQLIMQDIDLSIDSFKKFNI